MSEKILLSCRKLNLKNDQNDDSKCASKNVDMIHDVLTQDSKFMDQVMTNMFELGCSMLSMATHYKTMQYILKNPKDVKVLIGSPGSSDQRSFLEKPSSKAYLDLVKSHYKKSSSFKTGTQTLQAIDLSEDDDSDTIQANKKKTKLKKKRKEDLSIFKMEYTPSIQKKSAILF